MARKDIPMLQIGDTIISMDLLEEFFLCDLNQCKGECCVEGDAGAPLTDQESAKIEEILPIIWDDLLPQAQAEIKLRGVSYTDEEGDLVTTIVNGKDCVFTYYDKGGICKCAIEKAYREGRVDFYKPVSCHLYPIRCQEYSSFTAVNYHRWKICSCARNEGKKSGVLIYQFLKEPLIRKFGEAWYNELELIAQEFKKQNDGD